MYPGGPGHGALVQQPFRAQGLSRSKLPDQCPEAGEGVSTGPQQGCIQQVEGLRGSMGFSSFPGRGKMPFVKGFKAA